MCDTEQYEALARRLEGLEGEVEHLKAEVAMLRSWTDGWPAERERVAISALMRAEIELYRQTAELALTRFAATLHEEISTLRVGMTEGASDAIADVATKVQLMVDLHARLRAGQVDLMTRLQEVALKQDQGSAFDAGMERMIATYQDSWAVQKAEQDALRAAEKVRREQRAQHEAHEKAVRLERDRRKAARDARRDKLAAAVAVPMLTSAATTPMALLLALSGTLPSRIVIVVALALMTFSIAWGVYWLIFRAPREGPPADERGSDLAPPPADGSGPPAPPVVTTATTTVTTTVTPPQEAPP